ncbi:MAG TPA: hypothetical protein VN436_07115 [Holophaga sp.]|nr:hypothetical protein [Holophaga sp.]
MALTQLINSTRRAGPMFAIKGRSYGFQGGSPEAAIPPEKELQKMEAGGATPKELAMALMNAYQVYFPEFRGLSRGFRRREQLSPRDPQMGVWALVVFQDGWRVLDHLGTTPEDLVRYLLGRWSPSAWMEAADLLRIPSEHRGHLESDRLMFGPQDHPLDLGWLGGRLACGLTITGPIPGLTLPSALTCAGDIHMEGVQELRNVQSLTAPGKQLTLKACPDLETIELPESTGIIVQDCPRLVQVRGKVTGNISVVNCPGLTHLDIVLPRDSLPAPSLIIRSCSNLRTIGRVSGVRRTCKDLILEDCPVLSMIHPDLIVRGKRRITGCPLLPEWA